MCQDKLFQIKTAEGSTPARQNPHICNLAHNANLDKLNAEKIKIILTINSIDPAEKTLKAVGQQNQQMDDTLFKKLLAEHDLWYQNQTNTGAKARRVTMKEAESLDSKSSSQSFNNIK